MTITDDRVYSSRAEREREERDRLADDLHSAHREIDRVITSNEELRAEVARLIREFATATEAKERARDAFAEDACGQRERADFLQSDNFRLRAEIERLSREFAETRERHAVEIHEGREEVAATRFRLAAALQERDALRAMMPCEEALACLRYLVELNAEDAPSKHLVARVNGLIHDYLKEKNNG